MLPVVLGVILRLALCALFYYVARRALVEDTFSEMLGDLAERLDRERSAFQGLTRYRLHIQKAFFGFSVLFFLLAGWHIYRNVRHLSVKEDPIRQTSPYSGSTWNRGGTFR